MSVIEDRLPPEIRSGWVEVVVKIDGASHLLGNGLFMYEEGEDAAGFAKPVLEAWDKSREQAERTLRLFGAEGLARNLLAGDSNQETERP